MNEQTTLRIDECRDLAALASRSAATPPTPGVASLPRPGQAAAPASPDGPPRVIGIDLSLRSTGVASNLGWTQRVTSTGKRGDTLSTRWVRMRQLANSIEELAKNADLAVIEGPSYASAASAGTWDRGGLWWLVVDRLRFREIPVAVVPPSVRCRYACGKGNASKDQVLAAVVRRFPDFDVDGNDVADAVVLAALGADWLGFPVVTMPAAHREAIGSAEWPEREAILSWIETRGAA